jgi:hypothetical protein
VLAEAPTIVRDRLIYGEVYSLIPLEAAWCRGYMMLQIEERSLRRLQMPPAGRHGPRCSIGLDSRHQQCVLGDHQPDLGRLQETASSPLTTPALGKDDSGASSSSTTRSATSHSAREDPQLCFPLPHLGQPALQHGEPIELHQRFVFNLSWSPELFRENQSNCRFDARLGRAGVVLKRTQRAHHGTNPCCRRFQHRARRSGWIS